MHAALGDPARLAIVDALALGDAAPGELARGLGMASNLVAHHLNVLENAAVIARSRSEGDRRRTYVRLRADTIGGLLTTPVRLTSRVVFVCTHNSARSQLAAALWAHRSHVPVASAGTAPADRVHPRAVGVARRHGLTLVRSRTAHVSNVIRGSDLIVAVCDNAHEHLAGRNLERLHWSVPDPAAIDTDEAFEASFVDIADRIDRLAPALTASEGSQR